MFSPNATIMEKKITHPKTCHNLDSGTQSSETHTFCICYEITKPHQTVEHNEPLSGQTSDCNDPNRWSVEVEVT